METTKRCKDHPMEEPKLQVNPGGSVHYGKWLCSICNKHLSHAKKPKTTKEMQERQLMIRMAMDEEWDQEDLHRLLTLYNAATLNMIQSKHWEELKLKYGLD